MANDDGTLDPVDALKTEHADDSYEFPTSASMDSGKPDERSSNGDDRSFREASQSWDASGSGSSSGKMRTNTRDRLADVQDAMSRKYRIASDTTEDFVYENSWKAITMAALAGLVIGMLVSR